MKAKLLVRWGNEAIFQKGDDYFWIIASVDVWDDKNCVDYSYYKFVGDNIAEHVTESCKLINYVIFVSDDDNYFYEIEEARSKYTEWQDEMDGSREVFIKWCKE